MQAEFQEHVSPSLSRHVRHRALKTPFLAFCCLSTRRLQTMQDFARRRSLHRHALGASYSCTPLIVWTYIVQIRE
jgi:hypothetical protein